MPQDDGIHGESASPDQLVQQHREDMFPEFRCEITVFLSHLPYSRAEFPAGTQQGNGEHQTDSVCNDRSQSRPRNLHSRKSEVPVNKESIQQDIQDDNNGAHKGTPACKAAILQDPLQDLQDSGEYIGQADPLQIFDSTGDQRRIIGEQAHEQPRREAGRRQEQQGDREHVSQDQCRGLAQPVRIPFPIKLRDEHVLPDGKGCQNEIEDKRDLRGQRNRRERSLIHPAQHVCIACTYKSQHELLRRNRQRELQDSFAEFIFHLPPLPSCCPDTASNSQQRNYAAPILNLLPKSATII